MIPKIIHYCWFGGKSLPNDVKKCIKTWETYCPDYEIKQWDETNFDVNCHPFVKSAYEAKAWAFVSDFARLKIIYDYGGVYFDTDVELLKNIDFLLKNQCFIGVQQCGLFCTTGLGFGAVKANQVVYEMLKQYDHIKFSKEDHSKIACPYLNSKVFEKLGYQYQDNIVELENATVYPVRFFDPIAPGDSENYMCEDTVSIHHYSASWLPEKNRIKRKIIRLIGPEKIYKLKNILKR